MAKDEPEVPTGEYSLVPEAFDFDDDSISSLLDTFVSTQTGPQEKHVSHPADPLDAGAQAAQRTVFQHAPREEALPLVGHDTQAKTRRIELLRALAERSTGSARAGLLTHAAELLEQVGEPEDANQAYREAVLSNPRDVVALRAVRRHAMRSEDWEAAASSLRQEASLELSDDDRASALDLLAHLHLQRTGDRAAAEQAAREAASLCPRDFVAQLLVATACLARGDLSGAGAAIADAAPAWADAGAQAVLLQHAGALMEQGEQLAEARGLYEQASALDPGSLPARFGLIRAARALGDYADSVRSQRETANGNVGPESAAALRRAAAVDLASHLDDPYEAIALLREASDWTSAWTRAEIAAAEDDLDEAVDALQAPEAEAARAIGIARHARFLSEQRNVAEPSVHVATDDSYGLEGYMRAAQRLRGEEDGSELRLVLDAMHAAPDTVAADMVTADKTALLGDTAAALAALERGLERASEPLGPALAVAELTAEVDDSGRSTALHRATIRIPHDPMLRRAIALASREDTASSARAWQAEAEVSAAAQGAFAHGMAARLYLREARAEEARLALEAALQQHLDYAPALWALEDGPFDREVRARAAAGQAGGETPTPVAHWVRASMWAVDPSTRLSHAEAALACDDSDPLVLETVVAWLGADSDVAGDLLRSASHEGRATRLSHAAMVLRCAGSPALAAKALREARAEAPDDRFLQVFCEDVELEASEFARVSDAMMTRAREAADENEELTALYAMAAVDRLARRDMQSARLSLQSIAESRPAHIPTARALESDALHETDVDRILSSAKHLLECLPQETPERAARHRLRAELWAADPDMEITDVDRLLRDIEDDIDADPGLARRTLGMAYARGDTAVALRALAAIQAHMSTDLERSAIALERAHQLENAGEHESALALLADDVATHPLGLEVQARLLRESGRWEEATARYEEAAQRAKDGQRAASLWRAAATIFEDELEDRERAVRAFVAATEADITYLDVYRRLVTLYRAQGRATDAEALTGRRIDAGADTPTLVALLLEQAAQRRERGDIDGVVESLDECLELDPGHFAALRELVDTHQSVGNWQGATEALIRIARLKRSVEEQVWAFAELGAVYDERLQDLPRAEAALQQVLKLAPAHDETLDRLASVLSRQSKSREAGRVLEELVRRVGDPARNTDYRIRLAAELEATGQGRHAEAYLERLRAERPTEVDVILALADHYERQGATAASAMHLNRALVDLHNAINARPQEESLWTTMVRVLARRHGRGPASCAASAAVAAGFPPSLFEGSITERHEAFGRPDLPLLANLDQLVTPKILPPTVLRLFSLCEAGFDKVLPFDASAWKLRRVPGKDRGLIEEAGLVAESLGVSEPKLRVTSASPTACMPISGDPPTLVVGDRLGELTTREERVFLFARAITIASNHLAPALRAEASALDAALLALLGTHEASRAERPPPPQAQELRKKLVRSAPRRARDEIESLVLEIRGDRDFSSSAVPMAIADLGSHVALTLTGDVPSAVHALLKASGRELPATQGARLSMIREVPEVWNLIRFATSNAHFEARAQAGVDP